MRILIYTQFCTPEPFTRSVPFARELIRRGHDVRILTGFPNYPGGRIYPGYRQRLWQDGLFQGVPIRRVCLYPSHDNVGLRRIMTYCSFPLSSLPHLLFGWRPDLVYVYGLVTKGLAAVLAGKLRTVPFVFDIQDLWPDAVMNSGMGKPWMIPMLRAACNCVYRHASRIVVLSPGFKRTLVGRGVPEGKIEVVYNWADEDSLLAGDSQPGAVSVPQFAGRFNILFAGGMGKAQGLHAVIKAAALLGPSHPQIQFVFMGSGRLLDELKREAAERAPRNTLFLDRRPPAEAAVVMQAADVLLVHLRKHALYEITIPSKTQAYLAMGKPILSAVGGDAAALVQRAGAGLSCEPECPESIAEAAVRLAELPRETLQEMGRLGRQFYDSELCLRVGAARMERVFLQAVQAFHAKASGRRAA